MCDTFSVMHSHSASGMPIFAKNSDRDPNEPQIFVQIEKSSETSSSIRTSFIDIEGYPRVYDVLLSKPVWLWGGEMGTNSAGVSIGNEAVFTRMPYRKTGLTGMDLLRIALERCGRAADAVSMIIAMLEQYHQGGNCSYDGKLLYHNSFLVMDADEGFILETADDVWVYRKIDAYANISNRLSITNKYDAVSPFLRERTIDFSSVYSNPIITFFTGSSARMRRGAELLAANSKHTRASIIELLSDRVNGKATGMSNLCMNAGGGLINSQTTASMIVEYGKINTIWYTMSPCPEIALFKPAWFTAGSPLSAVHEKENEKRWKLNNYFYRQIIDNYEDDISQIRDLHDRTQEEIINLAEQAEPGDGDELLNSIMHEAMEIEDEYRSCALDIVKDNARSMTPFRHMYWSSQRKKLLKKETYAEIRALYLKR